ncbi:hypothetical protein P3W24_06670 [Luteibacter sp. PPL201]|uniref:Uncharacterized protein n=1 Tax=Luteibacter sahnii TaxID=3021977 RepID=A0ABT6B991_9GAMM
MDFDIELELHRRPDTDSAVGVAANRLQTSLKSVRNGMMHDHRAGDGPRFVVQTLPPANAPPWASDTTELWNRIEWTERAGQAPVLFEARAPVPAALGALEASQFGAAIACFIAEHLRTPVSFAVLPGSGPRLMRGEEGKRQVRLCFPTRALASPESPEGVLDRSGVGSGFGGRLPMVMNHYLAKDFVRTLTTEVVRLGNLHTPPLRPFPPLPAFPVEVSAGKDSPVGPAIDLGALRSISRSAKQMQPDAPPVGSALPGDPVDQERYPLVTRLRREAPRGMDIMELRDFEQTMDLSVEVEDALRDVTDQERERVDFESSQERLQGHVLEHRYLLDAARRRRARLLDELQALGKRSGLLLFLVGRSRAAARVRVEKAREVDRAKAHVRELKGAILRLQTQLHRAQGEKTVREDELVQSRARLRFSIRALAGNDPRVLTHLTGIVDDVQRAHLKACMDAPGKPAASPGKVGHEESEGKSGPPSHPAPPGSRPRARVG